MATHDSAARILPRPAAPRRSRRNAAPAAPRLPVPRRRILRGESAGFSGEQVDTWVLQGTVWAAMAGMVIWFHGPLGEAVRAIF